MKPGITTIYRAVCNGYDKVPKMPAMCEHTEYTVVAGFVDKARASFWNRYHKIASPPLITEYSLYLDGNIGLKRPICEIHHWVENMLGDADMAICKHADRRCAYVEVEACVGRKKITSKEADIAHGHLIKHDLPRNFGLWECGIILRRNGVAWVDDFCREWFRHILETNVTRDQLWLPLAMKLKPPQPTRFKTLEMNVRKNDYFTFQAHA